MFILAPCAQLYSLAETPQLPTLPPHLGSYTRALLLSQNRRHLYVTPWCRQINRMLKCYLSVVLILVTASKDPFFTKISEIIHYYTL